MRITVGTVAGLVAAGHSTDQILREYPCLEVGDIAEALSYEDLARGGSGSAPG